MKTTRYNEPKILLILRQDKHGVPIPELAAKTGCAIPSFINGAKNIAV